MFVNTSKTHLHTFKLILSFKIYIKTARLLSKQHIFNFFTKILLTIDKNHYNYVSLRPFTVFMHIT